MAKLITQDIYRVDFYVGKTIVASFDLPALDAETAVKKCAAQFQPVVKLLTKGRHLDATPKPVKAVPRNASKKSVKKGS